ncbi:MAG TPA: branched-chain amino acid transaminase, partial [Natronoarchaeum rubrum]|nr:branched-chain amino acid transaminase [Natronoarchaeum rubrum]
EVARDLGYTVHDEATISRGQLHTADELFFTGTAAEVTPIRQVDNVEVGAGTRGPVTEEIQQRFFDLVEDPGDEYADWFTYV